MVQSATVVKLVQDRSVLGPLLFNVYINDLFFMVTDTAVCNFADDTTIFAAEICLDKVLERLEIDALNVSKWFPENFMKVNEGKYYLLPFGTIQSNNTIKIGEAIVEESSEEKLLGVILDEKLNFRSHISNSCKRASQKLHTLARISTFMNPEKLSLLMNSFIKLNKIHERAPEIVYKDTHADYEALSKLENAVSVHQRNLQYFMTEIYKTKNSLNPSFTKELSKPKDLQYDLRNKNALHIPKARTTSYDIGKVQYTGQKLWQMLLPNVRESPSLKAFKKEIKILHNQV